MIHNDGAARSASPVTRAAIGFLAAAVAVLTFHAAAWELMHLFGRMPAPYPMRSTPPLGVPVIASLTFWGALYGIPFGIALPYLRRPLTLWGFGLGLLACLVGWIVVAPIKGGPPVGGSIAVPIFVNGVWGIGVALLTPLFTRWTQFRQPGAVIGVLAFGSFVTGPARAEMLVHHDLPAAVAVTIAQAAIESCVAKGYPESAVVVDREGETIVAIRGDNAQPYTVENARRKAYTAMNFRIPSADYAKRYVDNNAVVRQQVTLPNIIAIPGGLPIKVGNEVVGGVGASGSPGVDEPCVQAGLDKVADQLK